MGQLNMVSVVYYLKAPEYKDATIDVIYRVEVTGP